MSRRRLNEDGILRLLEDLSTPELSSSDEDPFCDDGEYGSDKDFEPDFKELSSDSDCPRKRQRLCIKPNEYPTKHDETDDSDTELEDELSVDTALPKVNITASNSTVNSKDNSPSHSRDDNQFPLDQTSDIASKSSLSKVQLLVNVSVGKPEHEASIERTTSTHSVEQPSCSKTPPIESNMITSEIFDEQSSSQQAVVEENIEPLSATRRGLSPTVPTDDTWHETTEPIPIFDFDYSSAGLRVSFDENQSQNNELDMFKLMFSDHLLEYLVSQTNSYGLNLTYTERPQTRHSRKQVIRDVNKEEMLAFLGLCLLQGQCNIPMKRSMFSYSNALYYHPFFSYTMSQRRFEQILRCLYVGEVGARREKKIVDFIEALCNNFRTVYGPYKELSLDESLILFRGRLDFRQYIKNKKARYGIKFYELTSSDGYVLNIIMYTGKTDNTDQTCTKKTEQIVMKLLNPYLMKGHHVYMDNFYNDVELSQKLLRLRTHTCGTLRKNRVTNPRVLTNAKLKKGDHIWRRKGHVYVSAWKDKRPVYIVTNNNHPGLEWVANRFGKLSKKPKEVAAYNQFMGGIDRKDQMVSYYSSPQKTIRWYKKVFFHMLDVCVWNAFYVHKKYFRGTSDGRYEFIDFRDALIKQMTNVDKKLTGRDVVRSGSIYSSRKTNTTTPPEITKNNAGGHWPELIPCAADAKRKFKFLNCKLCTKNKIRRETKYKCRGCEQNTPLCPNCFEEWHAINEKVKDN